MEFNTEHMDLKINKVDYKLELLTYEGTEKLLDVLDGITEKDGKKALKIKGETLLVAGLPVEVLKKLQMKHVNEIFEGLCGTKND